MIAPPIPDRPPVLTSAPSERSAMQLQQGPRSERRMSSVPTCPTGKVVLPVDRVEEIRRARSASGSKRLAYRCEKCRGFHLAEAVPGLRTVNKWETRNRRRAARRLQQLDLEGDDE